MKKESWLTLAVVLAMAGCGERASTLEQKTLASKDIEQERFCQIGFEGIYARPDCKPGQKVAFLPDRFGNEQLPLLFVMNNCDLRYEVAMTRGGVVCIYLPSKRGERERAETEEKDGAEKKENE